MPTVITIEFREHQEFMKLLEDSEKIAYSDLPPKKKLADLRKLQASCRESLADVPEIFITEIEENIRNSV